MDQYGKSSQTNSIESKSMVKTYIDMNTKQKTKAKIAKSDFEKYIFKLMNNKVFGKKLWKM